ncbi:MAG: sialidase family protein, partial [Kiritimatiellae bacterium]|nr:sialidase family protein [Kiritimatiellia bacterium]
MKKKLVTGFVAMSLVCVVEAREAWEVEDMAYPGAHVKNVENETEMREMYRECLEKLTDFALVPPKIRQDKLGEFAATNLDYCMSGTIGLTPGGRLYAGWISGEDGPKGFFVSNRSDDRGATWSEPCLAVKSQDPRLALARLTLCTTYWTDPDGRLHAFIDQSLGMYGIAGIVGCTTTDGRRGFFESVCENPDAEKPTWTKPRRISDGHALNKPIILKNGDWLLPVARGVHGGQPFEPAGVFREVWSKVWGAWWMGSSDKGKTWKMRGGVRFPDSQWFEHMAYEMKDGRLRMFARTRQGLMQSYSPDGGYTWTKPSHPGGMDHPLSRFFIRRLNSGALLFVKHGLKVNDRNNGRRSNLTAWVSDDDGETWKGGLLLEPLTCSYPDGVESPDGTIYIVYDHERDRAAELRMARFTE